MQKVHVQWIKLLNRECSLAFSVEVATSNRDILKREIGFSIKNFWYDSLSEGVYYHENELRKVARIIEQRIGRDSRYLAKSILQCHEGGKRLLTIASQCGSHALSEFSTQDILRLLEQFRTAYLAFFPYVVYPHAIERYITESIKKELTHCLRMVGLMNELEGTYQTLTTPVLFDFTQQVAIIRLAGLIRRKATQKTISAYLNRLQTSYGGSSMWSLTTKPLDALYFLRASKEFVRNHEPINVQVKGLAEKDRVVKNNLKYTLNHIGASQRLRKLVDLIQQHIYLRTYRKNVISEAHFRQLPLVLEIGKRMEVGKLILFVSYEEMIDFLKNGNVPSKSMLKERRKAHAVVTLNGHISILAGKKQIQKEWVKIGVKQPKSGGQKLQIIRGQVACRGEITGRACVVNSVGTLRKVHKGDVLVTRMTTPDFVSIFKKIAAIVTDEGGVTCHAAIVSREYNIPCIIGTHVATKVFRDGDLVRVNANMGTTFKLS